MTEQVLMELKRLREGLLVRTSMLRPDMAAYFTKDVQRLTELIESLSLSADANKSGEVA